MTAPNVNYCHCGREIPEGARSWRQHEGTALPMTMPSLRKIGRADALRLAQAKWGDDLARAFYWGRPLCKAVGKKIGNHYVHRYGVGRSWREACEKAGLLPTEAQ